MTDITIVIGTQEEELDKIQSDNKTRNMLTIKVAK